MKIVYCAIMLSLLVRIGDLLSMNRELREIFEDSRKMAQKWIKKQEEEARKTQALLQRLEKPYSTREKSNENGNQRAKNFEWALEKRKMTFLEEEERKKIDSLNQWRSFKVQLLKQWEGGNESVEVAHNTGRSMRMNNGVRKKIKLLHSPLKETTKNSRNQANSFLQQVREEGSNLEKIRSTLDHRDPITEALIEFEENKKRQC